MLGLNQLLYDGCLGAKHIGRCKLVGLMFFLTF